MRERAELYGGHLDASAGADGGFTVTGVIPYEGSAPDDRASRAVVPASGSR
jgi:signal transduction histidine kinase